MNSTPTTAPPAPSSPQAERDFEHKLRAMNEELMLSSIRQHELTEQAEKAKAAVKIQNVRLRLLWEAAGVLLSTDDPDAILRGLLAKIGPPLGVDTYLNFMVDDTGDALRLASYGGIPEQAARSIEPLKFGQHIGGIGEQVASHRQSLVVTHIQQSDDPRTQLFKSFGLRVCACNPLMSDKLLLGTLCFASRTRDQFDPDELAVLQTICHYVAVAYERLRLLNKLRESDHRKDEFLAMLGHELRNPLAPITNAVELLRLQKNKGKLQQQACSIIERQVGQLTRLVDDLLEVSRITTGKIRLHQERVALNGIMERAVETTRPLMDQRGHEFTLSLSPQTIWLYADAARLEQVVVNLLTNAAKYTADGGRIALEVSVEGRGVNEGASGTGNEGLHLASHLSPLAPPFAVLRVRDTGVGIAPELLPHIFDLFTQAERSLDRSQGGLGIGLCLVQRLVEMHGGRVEVHSALGQGSEFVVRLPLWKNEGGRRKDETNPPDPSFILPPSSLKILVVDDNVDAAQSLALLLEVSGHDVRTAYDGPTALKVALDYRPNVVLLDIGLPGLDGFEVAKQLRQQPDLRNILLVALTGYGQATDIQRSREAGFDHHLVKPADLGKVKQILAQIPDS